MTVLFEGDLPIDKVMAFKVDGEQQFVRVEGVDDDEYDNVDYCSGCVLHAHREWVTNSSKVTRGSTTIQFVNDKDHRCSLGNCIPSVRTDGRHVRYVKVE